MRIVWSPDEIVSGVDRGVLYLSNGTPIPWNGLVAVTENSDEESIQTGLYFDGIRFGFGQSIPDFSITVEAWSYPLEFEPYEGITAGLETKQPRKPFGFSWRDNKDDGHLIHLVWNAMASPSEKSYLTKNNDPELSSFSWDFKTRPIKINGFWPTSHMVVDTNTAPEDSVQALEDLLYGTNLVNGSFPTPQEVIDLFLGYAALVVTVYPDGTWTAEGPDSAFVFPSPTSFAITWPSVTYIDSETYTISSL